ncbi:glycosyltransferase family 2 protein [Nocardioides lentus]|uniref:Glycosyltransferase family 2 protein n=1 Tax=Nocardioides lentus TaxID=338077 RepID=A0ABN2PMV5_9ACTN
MQLSIVVPCYNEQEVLPRLVTTLQEVLPALVDTFEVLLVDDGSRDGTLAEIRAVHEADDRFRYLALSRNFGKEAAMLAGLSHSRGEAVAILDADLQHPPALLAEMLPLLDEGYEQVVARRTRAGDPAGRSAVSRVYYGLMNRMVEVDLEDGVGDFRVLSRVAVQALLSLGEVNRFSKGLFSWIGFKVAVVDYENVARDVGASKWRLRDLLDYGIDGVLSFNSKPLRLSIWFGTFVALVAFVYALWVLVDAVVNGNPVAGYVTTICAVVGFGGVQMILLGVIGEYLGRIYSETKHRPHFLVRETSEGLGHHPVTVPLGPAHDAYAAASEPRRAAE